MSQSLHLLVPVATLGAIKTGCIPSVAEERDGMLATHWLIGVAMLIVVGSAIAAAVFCGTLMGGGVASAAALWMTAIFQKRLAALHRRCGLSMLQVLHSLSRDQALMSLAIWVCVEAFNFLTDRFAPRFDLLPPAAGFISMFWPLVAAGSMVVLHVCSLWHHSANVNPGVRNLLEQVWVSATIILVATTCSADGTFSGGAVYCCGDSRAVVAALIAVVAAVTVATCDALPTICPSCSPCVSRV